MSKTDWHAPNGPQRANGNRGEANGKRGSLLAPHLAGLLALLLAGCGASQLPNGIMPSEDGNFLLRVEPSDASVSLVPESSEAADMPVHNGSGFASRSGERYYELTPGRYSIRISKPGYRSVERSVEIPDGDSSDDGESGRLVLEVVLELTEPGNGDSGEGEGVARAGFDLRGDPNFRVDSLSKDQRLWYDRFWASIKHPNPNPDIHGILESDDEYHFARTLHQHNHALLLALRSTGDLRFLDEVDRVAQKIRGSLSDGWCDGVESPYETSAYGEVSGKDGYLNFRRRNTSDMVHYCRDIADLEETLMHGHLAMVMYAYHVNRDLPSPSGVDYGERSDFWLDYLRNHFEAKWRERSGSKFPEMDFIKTKFCHTHNQFTLYHYFVGKRLADDGASEASAYLDHARRMTDQMFDTPYVAGEQAGGFVDVDTPLGPAVVYRFGGPFDSGGVKEEACPTTYARYAVEAMMELNFEGFYRWADDGIMAKLANGVAHFVMEHDPIAGVKLPFAASVGGTSEVGGVPPTTYRERLDAGKYLISSYPLLALWDESGKIADVSLQAHREVEGDVNNPRHTFVSAAMLVLNTFK
jgi:hypothetical protein